MTPVRIEFAEQRRRHGIWMGALAVCVAMIAVLVLQWIRARQDIEVQGQDIAGLQAEMQKLNAPAPVKPDLRQTSNKQVLRQLNLDLSGVFTAVENLKIPGTRLNGITLDVAADKLQLDYEVESLSKAAQVTESLNAGNEKRPWKMESVLSNTTTGLGSSNVFSNPGVVTGQVPASNSFKAVWAISMNALL